MGLFDRIKEVFTDNTDQEKAEAAHKAAPADDLEIEIYEGQIAQFYAMSYCLNDLFIDGEMDIDKLIPELSAPVIECAKALYLRDANFDDIDEDELGIYLKNEWLLYYADALMVITCMAHGFTPDENNELEQSELTQGAIIDLNETLCGANAIIHNAFCSFMHYSHDEMPAFEIVDCVAFAQDSDEITIEGKSAVDWFPVARALKPDNNDEKVQAFINQTKNTPGPKI